MYDTNRKLKVLVSAYSLVPGRGSEPGVGWNITNELAKFHDVWVVTTHVGETKINELDKHKGLTVVYYDMPGIFSRNRLGSKSLRLHYYIWQLAVRKKIKRIHQIEGFDLAHHVTMVKYWAPAGAAWLKIPFVWGPVGGGEPMPLNFIMNAPRRAKFFEYSRWALRKCSHFDPFVRKTANKASVAIAVTAETKNAIKLLNPSLDIELLTQVGISESELTKIDSRIHENHDSTEHGKCIFLYVGNLLYWKGVHLAIKGFAGIESREAELWIVGAGEEKRRLKEMMVREGLHDKVKFFGEINRVEVMEIMRNASCLVHPSLHDSGGFVVVEAMANSKPVICLKVAGPDVLVPNNAGIKIEVTDEESVIQGLARAMNDIAENPELAISMGITGRQYVQNHLLWSCKAKRINSIYKKVLGGHFK
jgi:glycosyltransferase involved in cell wall biosynthesis